MGRLCEDMFAGDACPLHRNLCKMYCFQNTELIVCNSPGKRTCVHMCVHVNIAISLIKLDSVLLKADSLQSWSFIAGYSCTRLVYK